MTVLTSGYNAEYGRAAGGVINVNLKTGTNEIHGGLWEVLQNRISTPTRGRTIGRPAPRPVFRQNQFGGAAGVTIIKNHLFIFGDYQGTRIAEVAHSASCNTIPTPAGKREIFELSGGIDRIRR